MAEQANKMIANGEFNDDGYNRMAQEFIKNMRNKCDIQVIYLESIRLTERIASEEREKFEDEYEADAKKFNLNIQTELDYSNMRVRIIGAIEKMAEDGVMTDKLLKILKINKTLLNDVECMYEYYKCREINKMDDGVKMLYWNDTDKRWVEKLMFIIQYIMRLKILLYKHDNGTFGELMRENSTLYYDVGEDDFIYKTEYQKPKPKKPKK